MRDLEEINLDDAIEGDMLVILWADAMLSSRGLPVPSEANRDIPSFGETVTVGILVGHCEDTVCLSMSLNNSYRQFGANIAIPVKSIYWIKSIGQNVLEDDYDVDG